MTGVVSCQDVMVVGEPSLMGGEFGDEDERLITRLGRLFRSLVCVLDSDYCSRIVENNQYDPNAASGTNGLEDADDFNSIGSSTSGGTNAANNGNNSTGLIGSNGNGGSGSWPPNGPSSNNPSNSGNPSVAASNTGPPGNGPNSQDDTKKSPNLSQ